MELSNPNAWRKCSTCKNDILFGQIYYICDVSTCQAKRTNYAFCSVICWDGHLPIERHRADSASAIEKRAPRKGEVPAENISAPQGRRIIADAPSTSSTDDGDEILVVVSKTKKYIADKSGMNTSAGVYKILTEKIKRICDQGIEEAKRQGRKTVLDRDII
ncbi:MAG: hypothetical protein JWQ35_218 [Bacteriovoracaceae bacterium]|nr:hypothetical protein [Bacteriovoracaceae bacterium]